MAILDADNYIKCNKCNKTEFKVESRGPVKDNGSTYIFESYKAIVCCHCGDTYDKISRFSGKILLER